jgi:hypothetical protein
VQSITEPLPTEPDLGGRWVNEGGTVIDLRSHDDGRLSGTIRFAADGTRYRTFELRGTRIKGSDGHAGIVGTVPGWPHPESVTVWCGDLDSAGGILATTLLSAGDPPLPLDWDSVAGGAQFRRRARRSVQRSGSSMRRAVEEPRTGPGLVQS